MRPHGYMNINPHFYLVVRIYCDAESDFHRRRGKTWLGTFARSKRPLIGSTSEWREVHQPSRRTASKSQSWRDNAKGLTDQELGDHPHPFPGAEFTAGVRPPALTYLRGDVVVSDPEQQRIAEALTSGLRQTARGPEPATAADLAGRAKLDCQCKCGEPPLRARGEDVWLIFEDLVKAGHADIEAATLRRELRRRKGR